MRNLAASVSTWKRLVLASVLAAAATLCLQAGGPAAGAGPGPTPLAGAGVTVLSDTVVLASSAQTTITFENQTGADLDASLWSTGLIDPADIAPGTPAEGQLTAAGVDVAALGANSPSATGTGNTCTGPLAATDRCTVSVRSDATIAPVGVSLRFADSTGTTVTNVLVVWPSSSIPAPSNDDWANAEDVSGLSVPPFDGSFTGAGVAGTTVGATREAAEPEVDDGFGSPSTLGTVWYRYESPPGGFEGLLGFQVTSGFLATAYAAYETDPFNPFLGLYPDEGPGALDRLAIAPQYTVRRDLPGGLFSEVPVVRVEPGQKVWFQVLPNPRPFGASPGPFTFELYHVDDAAERVATAAAAYDCGTPCGPLSTFSQIGYADTFAASPQPQGPASSWLTFEVATPATFALTASSQKASRRESDRPLTVEVFRAPTSAPVSDPAELGAPVASSTGASLPFTTWSNGQWTVVQQWQTEVAGLAVTPGRYYARVTGTPTFVSYWARLTPAVGRPPSVTIFSPTDGARFARPEDVSRFSFGCNTPEGLASTTIVIDGVESNSGLLPTTLGTHVVVVTCTDLTGASASDTATYTVDPPPPPLIVPDFAVSVPEDGAETIDLLARVSAGPGVTVALTGITGSSLGSVTTSASGTVVYVPFADLNGPDSFSYTVTAADGRTATGTVSITVTPVNDPPVAVDDSLAVDARRSVEVDLAQLVANDTDIDGGPLAATSIARSGGTVTGQLTACSGARPACRRYTAPATAGTETFDYVVDDGNGGTDTGRLTITVLPSLLPDDLAITMPCENLSVSGPTVGIRVTNRGFGLVRIRGNAQIGLAAAQLRVTGVESAGVAFGRIAIRAGSIRRTLLPTTLTSVSPDTWVLSGTYRAGGQRCSFQITVRDGG